MTDARTDRVSPRKLAATGLRRPMSRVLCAATALVAFGLTLDLRGAAATLGPSTTAAIAAASKSDTELAVVVAALLDSARAFTAIVAPLLAALVASVVLAGAVQRLAPFAARPSASSDAPSPFDLAARFSQLLAPERALDALVSASMLLVLVGVAWLTLAPNVRGLLALSSADPRSAAPGLLELFGTLVFRLALAGVALGALDYLQRRVRFTASLRMTRRELIEEQREQYGDPAVRAERARLRAAQTRTRP